METKTSSTDPAAESGCTAETVDFSELDEFAGIPFVIGRMMLSGAGAGFDKARCVELLWHIEENARFLRRYFENMSVCDTDTAARRGR